MKITENFNKVILEKKENTPPKNHLPKEIKLLNSYKSKGWYNGEIFNYLDCEIKNKTLFVKCNKIMFFDYLVDKQQKPFSSKNIGVNAIIEVEDSIILIKREEDDFGCPNYMDFPAGILPFNEDPINRLINRIEKDTKLKKEHLTQLKLFPMTAEFDISFNLFYKTKCKLSKKQLQDFFNKNFKENKPILVQKSKIAALSDKPIK